MVEKKEEDDKEEGGASLHWQLVSGQAARESSRD